MQSNIFQYRKTLEEHKIIKTLKEQVQISKLTVAISIKVQIHKVDHYLLKLVEKKKKKIIMKQIFKRSL